MFYKCFYLDKLDLSHFKTDKVKSFSYMFYECFSLNELNISNFKACENASLTFMFGGGFRDSLEKVICNDKLIQEKIKNTYYRKVEINKIGTDYVITIEKIIIKQITNLFIS